MKEYQKELVAAWKDFVAGIIDAKTLKSKSAGFGIYQQKDGLTMMRIRRPGGIVTIDDLRNIAKFIDKYGAGYAHISTRQDIQIHGVKAEDVPAALEDCESMGFPFRGGGGDTFRNTLVSTASGLKKESVFDVIPYARALSAAFKTFDKAYALPRKIKIGFADCDRSLPRRSSGLGLYRQNCGRQESFRNMDWRRHRFQGARWHQTFRFSSGGGCRQGRFRIDSFLR